ncbi:MAG TPA: phage tail protein [Terracidiphilus sp.]|jgi:phage tail-like protein
MSTPTPVPRASTVHTPYTCGNFRVEIDGIAASSFSEVSGLEASIDVVEYRAGDAKLNAEQKLPGLHKYNNITLKRGLTQDTSLWNWINSAMSGVLNRANVAIILLDQADNPVLTWRVRNAWPCKWSGPVLSAQCSEVAIETLELTHEGIDLSAS